MIDIEKTLEDLKLLNTLCHGTVLDDALALLKEQEETINDLTETIRQLNQHIKDLSEYMTPYGKVKDVKAYAELLKEQEHGETFTVIDTKTGKEADEYEIALHEDWAKHLCYCDMEGWAIMDDGSLLLVDECGRFEYADRERFKVVWDA